MDNKDSNMKPQQTGGLKLMTVFVVVIALHVVVIGGYSAYELVSGGNTDADLANADKSTKNAKASDNSTVADGAMPDLNQGDKTTTAPATDVASTTANPPAQVSTPVPTAAPSPIVAPAPDQTASSEVAAPAPAPAVTPTPAPAMAAPKISTPSPASEVVDKGSETPSGPIPDELAPPAEPAPATSSAVVSNPEPEAPVAAGPVHMPPAVASTHERSHESIHQHEQIYVVKITDSYKKIAHAHHVTVAQLKEANHITGNVLHMGQKLFIPSSHTAVASNGSSTSGGLDASPVEPMLANSVTSTLTTPTMSHHHLYTVVKGDTLVKIAHRFKTTTSAIMAVNDIANPAKLSIGKKLKIPSPESRSARNSVPASMQPTQVQTKQDDASAGQLANFVP